MTGFFRRHALLLTALLLFTCCFQLMSLSITHRDFPRIGARLVYSLISPIQKLYHETSESTKYLWSHYLWLLDVEDERNDLLERVKVLEAQNSRLMEFESENQRLRRLLQFSEETGHVGVAASVVGRDPSNWLRTITIDRGSADGIKPGFAVVEGNAIVGQTTAVTPHSSQVLLLLNSSSAVDAIVQSSRASGIAEGGLESEMLRLRYVQKLEEAQVHAGDRVIASGIDGVFPKGALIGVVHKVNAASPGLFQYIEVKPSADLHRLENVLVIIPGSSTVSSQEDPH